MEYIKPMFLLLFVLGIVAAVSSRHAAKHYPVEDAGNQDESSLVKKTLKRHGSSLTSAFDIGEEKNKRTVKIGPGDIIDGASLGITVLQTILDTLGNIERKVAIGVDNESGTEWKAINVYFFSGTSDKVMPREVSSGKALLYGARKTAGPVATGVVGVFTYFLPEIDKTLAVMFSVPFDYNWYSNWFDAQLYSGRKNADKDVYEQMYYGDPFEGDNGWHVKDLGSGLQMEGSMSSSGQATIEIHIVKE